jgi:predicted ATP-grasp superfamily ATP-dependent carboligase
MLLPAVSPVVGNLIAELYSAEMQVWDFDGPAIRIGSRLAPEREQGAMGKVLVLGSVSRTILAVIRSLGRGGVEVHSAWNSPRCVSQSSRYLKRNHLLPPYDEADPAWLAALCELMQRERFDLVLPCSDIDTLACWKYRSELQRFGRVYTPNDEACQVLFDKHKTNEVARSLGVQTPREVVVESAAAAEGLFSVLGTPLVLKPRRTFDLANSGADCGVRKARNTAELRDGLSLLLPGGPVAVQENFVGRGAGIELLLDNGEPLLAFQHERVHEPLPGGQSCYRKSVPLRAELLKAAVDLLRAVRYRGVAMVEFKVNPDTLDWVFIEVNARFWGSLPLAVASGADFPLALYQFLVNGRREFPQAYRAGIHCRNLTLDLEWQIANALADRRDKTLSTVPFTRVIRETITNVATLRERSDAWAMDDPGPGFAELKLLGKRFGSKRAWGAVHRLIEHPSAS